jgi:dTDP-4-dehydrorhamnose 3,5-epimerase
MTYSVQATKLRGVLVLEPKVFSDERGFFLESFSQRDFFTAVGINSEFVQDNHSHSKKNVLRGLHYQVGHPQGKLVRVVKGEVFDVAVNLQR